MALEQFNLLQILPNHLFVKTTEYLIVNDLEHLEECEIDNRTELALETLEHAVICVEEYQNKGIKRSNNRYSGLNGKKLMNQLKKLPKNIKSIKILPSSYDCIRCFRVRKK